MAYDVDNRGGDLRSFRNWSDPPPSLQKHLTMRRDDQLFLDDASSHHARRADGTVGQGQSDHYPDASVQHRVWAISGRPRGYVALPEANRSTVGSAAGDSIHLAHILALAGEAELSS